jgi:hypothetical protein
MAERVGRRCSATWRCKAKQKQKRNETESRQTDEKISIQIRILCRPTLMSRRVAKAQPAGAARRVYIVLLRNNNDIAATVLTYGCRATECGKIVGVDLQSDSDETNACSAAQRTNGPPTAHAVGIHKG